MCRWEGSLTCKACKEYRSFPFIVLTVIHLDCRRRIFVCTNLGFSSLQPGLPAKLSVHVQALTESTCRSTHRMKYCVRNFYSQSTKEKNHWAWRQPTPRHPPGRARGLREIRPFCILLFLPIPPCDAIFCLLPPHTPEFSFFSFVLKMVLSLPCPECLQNIRSHSYLMELLQS